MGPTPAPWTPHGQVSLYIHDSLLNCLLWGLYNAGALKHSLQVASDLLATLMPAAAKARAATVLKHTLDFHLGFHPLGTSLVLVGLYLELGTVPSYALMHTNELLMGTLAPLNPDPSTPHIQTLTI